MVKRITVLVVALVGCFSQPSEVSPGAPSDMRLVPGAEFRMGTDSTEFEEIARRAGLRDFGPLGPEYPAHMVHVRDFYMDTVDVTNAAFAEFTEAQPQWSPSYVDPALHNGRYLEHWVNGAPPSELADHPVTFITWPSAVAYCEWRGKRLPTEVEYEWGAQDPRTAREYPWGSAAPHDTLVSWGGNGIEGTVPVGSYRSNSRGLYDMAGNVWRFVSDEWRGPYHTALSEAVEPKVDSATVRRVVRGGSWGANAANLRLRYRDSHRPFDAREMVGFRCAMSAAGA